MQRMPTLGLSPDCHNTSITGEKEMEVKLHPQHVGNMNNGHIGVGVRANRELNRNKSKSAPVSAGEFHSPSRSNHHDGGNNGKPQVSPEEEEMRQQTRKVMDAFVKSIVSRNGVAERIRQQSRERFIRKNHAEKSRIPSPSGRSASSKIQQPTYAPLHEGDKEALLYNVMTGQKLRQARHRSDASLASSDSAASGLSKGGFKRTESFAKAQRHSIVTELENKAQQKNSSRRSSEDIPQTLPMHLDGSFHGISGKDVKQAESPVSHTRASSDPVITNYGTTTRHKPQGKEKEKKGWFSKHFKKKKDSHKLKDDGKDSATSGEIGAATRHVTKVSKHHSDRKTVNREDSTASKRGSPSPPGSPKRAPKLIRRLSSRIMKVGKSESFNSSTKSISGSKSFDAVEEEDGLGRTNGDARSNSHPSEVRLSTKPMQSTHKKHKDNRMHRHLVAADGVAEHNGKSGRKSRQESAEVKRPTTLDLPKKKTKNWKKLIKMLVDSSSSSATSSPTSSTEELTKGLQEVLDRGAREEQVSKISGSEKERNSVKYSNSTQQRPLSDTIRETYQHRATKSMSDVDPRDKNLSEIAMKLKRVLEEYNHLVAQRDGGSAGHTHTPDPQKQYMQNAAQQKKTSAAPVIRSSSHATMTGDKVHTPSMKAYLNMSEASKPRAGADSGDRRQARRITRDQISHRPSGSFDSPHRSAEMRRKWSERVEIERQNPRSELRVVIERNQRSASPRSADSAAASSPRSQVSSASIHHRGSPRAPPPPIVTSTSPNLRASRSMYRYPGPSLDETDAIVASPHHTRLVERHTDRTIISSSAHGTRRIQQHTDVVEDIVETDAVPVTAYYGFSSTDEDMIAFADVDGDVTMRTEETVVTEEAFTVPAASAAPDVRLRSAAAAPLPAVLTAQGELDDEDDDESELGAVGGVDPNKQEIDMDKLVERLVEALCKKGDELNTELKTPQIEEALGCALSQLSQEVVQDVVRKAIERMREKVSIFSHPEVLQLALILNMASLFVRFTTQNSTMTLLNSFIERILKNFGGWSPSLMSSIDATTQEISELDEEAPGTSGVNSREKKKKSSVSSDDGELD